VTGNGSPKSSGIIHTWLEPLRDERK